MRQAQAKHMLGVMRNARRIAMPPARINLENGFDIPGAQIEAHCIQPGFFAHFADRSVLQRFARILRAGYRLPESWRVRAFHQQHLQVCSVDHDQH